MAKHIIISMDYRKFLVPPHLLTQAVEVVAALVEVEEGGDYTNRLYTPKEKQVLGIELKLVEYGQIVTSGNDGKWKELYENEKKEKETQQNARWKADAEASKAKQELETITKFKASQKSKEDDVII